MAHTLSNNRCSRWVFKWFQIAKGSLVLVAVTGLFICSGCSNRQTKQDLEKYVTGLAEIQAKLRPQIAKLESADERYIRLMHDEFKDFFEYSESFLAENQHLPPSATELLTKFSHANRVLVEFYQQFIESHDFVRSKLEIDYEKGLIEDQIKKLVEIDSLIKRM